MAERMLKTLQQSYPAVDYVVGNFQKSHFSDIAQAVEKNTEHILLEQDETYRLEITYGDTCLYGYIIL